MTDRLPPPPVDDDELPPCIGARLRCAVQGTDDDGELLPCVGGAIVDHLRAQFRAAFTE